MENFLKTYNIALIAPLDIAQKAIAISRSLERFGSVFILDGVDYTPHATLYMTEFAPERLQEVQAAIAAIAQATKPFTLRAETFFSNERNYVDIQYFNDPPLKDLHAKMQATLAPLRDTSVVPDNHYVGPLAEKMYQNVLDHGYSIGGDLYRPHLTLTKLAAPNATILDSLKWGNFDFVADKIAIYEADDLGCCRKLVKAFAIAT